MTWPASSSPVRRHGCLIPVTLLASSYPMAMSSSTLLSRFSSFSLGQLKPGTARKQNRRILFRGTHPGLQSLIKSSPSSFATTSDTSLPPTRPSLQEVPTDGMVFRNARVFYQPALVRVDAAKQVTPDEGITLLSLFGWTLGGVFVVEWRESPVGSYREVAVLSALVARGLDIGAWSSHIIVTTKEAVDVGRRLFGLPACYGKIEFAQDGNRIEQSDEFLGLEFLSDDHVCVYGWNQHFPSGTAHDDSRNEHESCNSVTNRGSCMNLNLPSFSGLLRCHADGNSPLLRYPLKFGPPQGLRLRKGISIKIPSGTSLSQMVRDVLDGPVAFPCIQIDGVDVVAGKPETL